MHEPSLARLTHVAQGPTLALALLAPGASCAAPLGLCTDLESSAEYLMDKAASSELTFIRNGTPHAGPEAAEHMQKKYAHFRKDIGTPQDFIRLAATRSLLSGRPYMAVNSDGKQVRTARWPQSALDGCRAAARTSPAEPGRQEP